MGNLFATEGTKTVDMLLADPKGVVFKNVAIVPGGGLLTKGVVLVRNAATGLYAPATAQTLIAGSICCVLGDDVNTGLVGYGTSFTARAYFRGHFLRGKVKLSTGELPAAALGVLNGMGIMLEDYVPATGAETVIDNEILDTVATPTADPAAGEVAPATEVTLATETEGATIYYTVDGSTPTAESTEYTAPIAISEAVTIKAIAVKAGMNDSAVLSAAYTVTG